MLLQLSSSKTVELPLTHAKICGRVEQTETQQNQQQRAVLVTVIQTDIVQQQDKQSEFVTLTFCRCTTSYACAILKSDILLGYKSKLGLLCQV